MTTAQPVAYPGAGRSGPRVVFGGWDLDDTAIPTSPVSTAPSGPADPGDGPAVPEGE